MQEQMSIPQKTRVAVFASGRGSNFEALIKHQAQHYEIVLLVSDKPNAGAISLAHQNHIPALLINIPSQKNLAEKTQAEADLVAQLKALHIEFIALAGYMRLVGDPLLNAFEQRIINIHPSLLPAHPGLNAIEKSFESQAGAGVTIHYVDSGMDTGSIIEQQAVATDEHSLETFAQTIHAVEHSLYPRVLDNVLKKQSKVG
jgi:phosphoribosylglycinamide formyltransferase-1